MTFIKTVLNRGKDEICSRCDRELGLRSHDTDPTWEFVGKVCNSCYNTITKGIIEYDAEYVAGSDARRDKIGWISIYLFDKKNKVVFFPKEKTEDNIEISSNNLIDCKIVTREKFSTLRSIVTIGSGGNFKKDYLKLDYVDRDTKKTAIFELDKNSLEKASGTITLFVSKHDDVITTDSGSTTPSKEQSEDEDFNQHTQCFSCHKPTQYFKLNSRCYCMNCFDDRFGKLILKAERGEYYGGHKAFLAGGYGGKCEYGSMYLTEKFFIFIKYDNNPIKQIEIPILLYSVMVENWRIEEESRRKQVSGTGLGAIAGSGIGGGFASGTVHDQGKAHHIVIPYVDENGIPQEPRFGISSIGGKLIRQWSEAVYTQIVKTKVNQQKSLQTQTTPMGSAAKNDDPIHVLKLRFAKGEISKQEFEDMKKMLE